MSGAPILVVDDAATNLKVIRMALTHEGYEVRTARRAEDALEMLASYQPELILADVDLPGMDGLDMARKVKDNPQTSGIRVVAFTANNRSDTRQRALNAGCEEYICKPIDTATLAAKVRELLARPRGGDPVPPKTEAARATTFGYAGANIETIRHRFLSDGAQRSKQLLDSLNGSFDPGSAADRMHQWVIAAGLLDFPEIGGLAERAEELLRADLWHAPDVREIFTELYIAFGERLESKAEPLPQTLVSASTGKYVALIGFAPDQAEDMCGVLERLKARALLFESDDPANAGAIQNCDAALVHVRPETLTNSWLRAETPNPSDIRLVLFGSRADLIDLPPATRARAAEFLVDGQDLEETAMRLAFAISRPAELATPPQPVAAPKREPAQSRRTITSPTVVLADDDEIVRTLTGSLLKNHGVTCRSAGNGLDALRLIRSERPAAALLDVNMPGMSGFEVLAAIRAENLPCRVMLLTAREREDDILRGFRLGADDYLTKPFNPFELMARLKRFLQQEEPTASVAKS